MSEVPLHHAGSISEPRTTSWTAAGLITSEDIAHALKEGKQVVSHVGWRLITCLGRGGEEATSRTRAIRMVVKARRRLVSAGNGGEFNGALTGDSRESRRCSRDTYPESCITEYAQYTKRYVAFRAMRRRCSRCAGERGMTNPTGKEFNLKESVDEVYCTNALLLLIKIMLCCKFHCQKVYIETLFL